MTRLDKKTTKPMRILVTGSAGAVGRAVCRDLKSRGHFVRGFDLCETANNADESIVADLENRAAISAAMADIDCVIHLAAIAYDSDFIEKLVPNNVIGVFNIFDLTRENKIPRIILASSLMAIRGHYGKPSLITCDVTPLAKDHYGLAKGWAEAMGEMYARLHGIDVIVARIGCMPRSRRNFERLNNNKYNPEIAGPHIYLSPADAGQFFVRAVEADCKGYHQFHLVSKPYDQPIFDMQSAKEILGYEPKDRWPEGGELISE